MMAGSRNKVRYQKAVPSARPLRAPPVRDDPPISPPEAALADAFLPATPPPAAERARSRLWSRFKAGR